MRRHQTPDKPVWLYLDQGVKALAGSAEIRIPDKGKLRGLYVVSVITMHDDHSSYGEREDIDSSACPFLARGAADSFNVPSVALART